MKPQAGWMKPDETTGGVDETTWDGGQGALKAETRGLTVVAARFGSKCFNTRSPESVRPDPELAGL